MRYARRYAVASVALGLAFMLASCSGGGSGSASAGASSAVGPKVTLSFEDYNGTTDPVTLWAQKYAAQVAKDSGGSIQIKVYPNSQLVSQTGALAALRSDSAAMGLLGDNEIQGASPALAGLGVRELPYISPKWPQSIAIAQSPDLLKISNTALSSIGLYELGSCVQGYSSFASTIPLTSMASFKDQKVRAANSNTAAYMKALGAIPVNAAIGDVYEGLQLHTFSIALSNDANIYSESWYQVAKYIDEIPLNAAYLPVVINLGVFKKLTPAQQAILTGDATKTLPSCSANEEAAATAVQQQMKQKGATIILPSSISVYQSAEATIVSQAESASPLARQVTAIINKIVAANP